MNYTLKELSGTVISFIFYAKVLKRVGSLTCLNSFSVKETNIQWDGGGCKTAF